MTGFRVSRSGQYGRDGVEPDLMTFGKVMGGGFPAAAFGGRADLMQHLAPVGGVYQAGTLSGNPGCDGGGARPPSGWPRTTCTPTSTGVSAELQLEVTSALSHGGRAARDPARREHVQRVLRPADGVTSVPDYATAATQSTAAYAAFFHAMLDSGCLSAAERVRGLVSVRRPR